MDERQRVLVTGATGFVGCFLTDALLRKGLELICLARTPTGRDQTAQERVMHVLNQINPECINQPLHGISGDITRPLAGLSHSTRAEWRGKIDSIWHCAADTSFVAPREEALLTNVIGVENMLDVCEDLRVPRFHLISTAYVCGTETGIAEEAPIAGAGPVRNVYEESKKEAENRLLLRAERAGILGAIFRLPVTMGHSQSGCTTQFLGYYFLAKAYSNLRRILDRFAAEDRHVLLRIYCVHSATVNMLPVDIVVETILRCLEKPKDSTTIFHITNGTPPTVRFLYEETLHYFGITTIEVVDADHPDVVSIQPVPSLRRIETSLRQSMLPYVPYLAGEPIFSRRNLEQQIGQDALPDFVIEREYLGKTLKYAVSHNWTKKNE